MFISLPKSRETGKNRKLSNKQDFFFSLDVYFGKLQLRINNWTQYANVRVATLFQCFFFFFPLPCSSCHQLRNCLDIVISPIHLNPLCQINLGNTRLMKWKHVFHFLPPVPSINELCKLNLPRALCQRFSFFFLTDWLLSHLIMRFVACFESGSGR